MHPRSWPRTPRRAYPGCAVQAGPGAGDGRRMAQCGLLWELRQHGPGDLTIAPTPDAMDAADVPPPHTRYHQHLHQIIPLFRNNPVSTRSTVPAPGSKLTNDCLWLERSLSTHNTWGLRHHNVCGQCKYLVSTNCTGKLYNEAVMKHSLDLVLLHDFSLSHRLNTISHIFTILRLVQ